MNTYRYKFVAACPTNNEQIVYSLEMQHKAKVLVEHIKTACALHARVLPTAIPLNPQG